MVGLSDNRINGVIAMSDVSNGMPDQDSAPLEGRDIALPWGQLATHLAGAGIDFDLKFRPKRFSYGFGNLNFLIQMDGAPAVLRRPPLGPIPPGANDMAREHRIIKGLNNAFVLAPRALHFCDDTKVLGAPFFIMEYRSGTVIGAEVPEGIANGWDQDELIGAVLSRHLIAILAELHALDPSRVNLDTLGKPEGFVRRTVDGWTKRADLAWEGDLPAALRQILDWLQRYLPGDREATLIHNDFKLDNVILDSQSLSPVAVIDWDMGTRGAPLYDLAVLLSYWTEASDPPVMHELRQMPSAGHGFPTRDRVAQDYARITGTPLVDLVFFRVLATLRIAVVFKQLHRRFLTGGTNDERFSRFGELADNLLLFGLDVANEQAF